MTPELTARIISLRQRAAEGTLTIEEMREAITLLRESRLSAASQPRRPKATTAAPIDTAALMDELDSL